MRRSIWAWGNIQWRESDAVMGFAVILLAWIAVAGWLLSKAKGVKKIPLEYVRLDGSTQELDLGAVVDVVDGWSAIRSGWHGYIIYSPGEERFIELMSTVPDVRGNSADEAAEVDAKYVEETYGLTTDQILQLRRAPARWEFIKKR